MSYQDWLPTSWSRHKDDNDNPFMALRSQVENLFEDFDKGFWSRNGEFVVRSNVSETESEICITAELPGLTDKDVDVEVVGNRIAIKGQKKSEKEEEGRQFHRMERSSGSFQRVMTMPFEIDPDTVSASVKDGVMTVTIPKPAEVVSKTRKIKITQA